MCNIEYIQKKLAVYPQLSHASNIIRKNEDAKTPATRSALDAISSKYVEYLEGIMNISGIDDKSIRDKVVLLNEYYNFIHNNGYDNLFSSQGKFRPTILEEFLFLLFNNLIDYYKNEYNDANNVLMSGNVKAYTNLYFKAKDFPDFINSPSIGINQKDQDYAIYRTFDISINGQRSQKIQIPAVAIEAKTYIDKTMLDSIIATAEKLKNGNPYTRFIVVAERYDVSFDVDPAYSRVDQIYILRKAMKKNEWKCVDGDVVLRLFKETRDHLERPWSDVECRLKEEGVII